MEEDPEARRQWEGPMKTAHDVMESWRFAHLNPPESAEEAEAQTRKAQADVAILYNLLVGLADLVKERQNRQAGTAKKPEEGYQYYA